MNYRKRHIHPKIKGLKKKKNFFQRPLFWTILFCVIITALVAYFLLDFKGLEVTNIEISGNQKIATESISNNIAGYINKPIFSAGKIHVTVNNILLVSGTSITKNILANFANIKSVVVQKKYPHTLAITIQERKPSVIFCNYDNACFFMDDQGVIFEPVAIPPEDMIILHQSIGTPKMDLGQVIVDGSIIEDVVKIQKNLNEQFQVFLKEVTVSDTLACKTNERWQIYFDQNQDIDMQISKMNVLLKDQIPTEKRKNLQYIYLQYKDRAYYK